jgi:hypothetical protein
MSNRYEMRSAATAGQRLPTTGAWRVLSQVTP